MKKEFISKIGQSHPYAAVLRQVITLTLSVVILLALAGRVGAGVVLQDDFSSGSGSFFDPAPSTVVISPQVGSGSVYSAGDDFQIATVGVGGTKAVQFYDTKPYPTYIQYTPATALKTGTATFSFDMLGHPDVNPLSSSSPIVIAELYSGAGYFGSLQVFFNSALNIEDGGSYYHGHSITGGTMSPDVFYHVAFALDLDAQQMQASITGPGLSYTTPFGLDTFGAAWNPSLGITSIMLKDGSGFWAEDPANFTTSAYGAVDNVLLDGVTPVPEPSSVLLLGLGAGLV